MSTQLSIPNLAYSVDMAHTQNKMFMVIPSIGNFLRVWNITLSPFTATYLNSHEITFPTSAGLHAKSDSVIILVRTSANPSTVVEMDISSGTPVFTDKFTLTTGRTVTGDYILTEGANPKFIVTNHVVSGEYYLSQYDYATGTLEVDFQISPDVTSAYGIFADSGNLYVINNVDMKVYLVNLSSPYGLTYIKTSTVAIAGASQVPGAGCINIELVPPSPTPSPSVSISPSITPSRTPSISISPSISITPSITPSKTPPAASPSPTRTPSITPPNSPSKTPSITLPECIEYTLYNYLTTTEPIQYKDCGGNDIFTNISPFSELVFCAFNNTVSVGVNFITNSAPCSPSLTPSNSSIPVTPSITPTNTPTPSPTVSPSFWVSPSFSNSVTPTRTKTPTPTPSPSVNVSRSMSLSNNGTVFDEYGDYCPAQPTSVYVTANAAWYVTLSGGTASINPNSGTGNTNCSYEYGSIDTTTTVTFYWTSDNAPTGQQLTIFCLQTGGICL